MCFSSRFLLFMFGSALIGSAPCFAKSPWVELGDDDFVVSPAADVAPDHAQVQDTLKIDAPDVPFQNDGQLHHFAPALKAKVPEDLSTLAGSVGYGVYLNPEYGEAVSTRRAVDEQLNQGQAMFLPTLDLNADTGREYTNDVSTRLGDGSDSEKMTRYETGVTLTQLLFDGWEAHYTVETQKARLQSSKFRQRQTAELVGFSIVDAYLEVLSQRKLLKVSQRNVRDHNAILRQIEESVEVGRTTQADLQQAKARLSRARSNVVDRKQSLANAEATYKAEVGKLPESLDEPKIPFDRLADDVAAEVEKALAHNPTLDIYTADIEASRAEADGAKASYYPRFDLQLNARQGNNLGGIDGRDKSASALVVMNWNLYRGGADRARVRELTYRHEATKSIKEEALRSIENDVRQTWASMVSARDRAEQYAAQARANAKVVRAYEDQFELGRRSLLDVLDAQNELFVTKSNETSAKYLEMLAVYRLLALKGDLLPSLGFEHTYDESSVSDQGKM